MGYNLIDSSDDYVFFSIKNSVFYTINKFLVFLKILIKK